MPAIKYGINKNVSRAGYVKAIVDERILNQTTEEISTYANQMTNDTFAGRTAYTDGQFDKEYDKTFAELIDETIKQLTEYKERNFK